MTAHLTKTTTASALLALALGAASCSSSDSGSPGDQGDSSTTDDTNSGGDSTSKDDTAGGSDTKAGADTSSTTDTTGVDTSGGTDTPGTDTPVTGTHVKTVFLILLENHSWSSITSSTSAPYINGTLVKDGASTKQYYNPPGNHPSEPNYIWLEAGDNLGLTSDADASTTNHTTTPDHIASQLETKGVTWRSYQEGISGTTCPLNSTGHYGAKHNPFVFFDDLTDGIKASSARCIAHNRPYSELAGDLSGGKVAQYNFITPDLCHDMHGDSGCPTSNTIKAGDDWLAAEVPKILASAQYKDNGALFIVWDESSSGDGPIGMILMSPLAKAGGYTNSIKYDHSSMVRTVEEIFGVPLLRGAKTATNLGDLFKSFP